MRKKGPNFQEFDAENKIAMARNKIVVWRGRERGHSAWTTCTALVENHPEYWSDDGVHFKPEGQAVLAKQVAKTILDALSK